MKAIIIDIGYLPISFNKHLGKIVEVIDINLTFGLSDLKAYRVRINLKEYLDYYLIESEALILDIIEL